jgi:hypothetical protein
MPILRGVGTLALQGFDTRDAATHFADARRLFELAGCALETQVELLALQLAELARQLVIGLNAEVFDLGHP